VNIQPGRGKGEEKDKKIRTLRWQPNYYVILVGDMHWARIEKPHAS